jgi:hypothetical protein
VGESGSAGGGVGEVVRAVADGLTAYGFDVSLGDGQPGQLYLSNVRGAFCAMSLTANGTMTWEYRPFHGAAPGPERIAGMVTGLLSGTGVTGRVRVRPYPGLALKGVVGRALTVCGLNVAVTVLAHDNANYEIHTAIEVTNPAQPARGTVWVSDDGSIRWECPSTGAAADGVDLAGIVQTIATVLAGCAT